MWNESDQWIFDLPDPVAARLHVSEGDEDHGNVESEDPPGSILLDSLFLRIAGFSMIEGYSHLA